MEPRINWEAHELQQQSPPEFDDYEPEPTVTAVSDRDLAIINMLFDLRKVEDSEL